MQETRVQSLDQEDPLKRKWQPIPVLLPGESQKGPEEEEHRMEPSPASSILQALFIVLGLPWWLSEGSHLPMQETEVQSLVWEDLLEKEMATHFSILAWEIPQTEEPSGLQSMGSQKSQTLLSE